MELSKKALSDKEPSQKVADVVHKNIRTMLSLRKEAEKNTGFQQKFATYVAGFAGSMKFVYMQTGFIAFWIFLNVGGVRNFAIFDPKPFPLLALITTVEAIFLAIFILISQNRISQMEEKREELDLQINLLTEHEVSRLIGVVDVIAKHLNVAHRGPELSDLKAETSPEKVLDVIEKEMLNQLKKNPDI